jgi:hypothetical protein
VNPETDADTLTETEAQVADAPHATDEGTPVPALPDAPVVEPVAPVPAPVPVVTEAQTVALGNVPSAHDYPSLYDTKATTVVAVLLGMSIIGGILYTVHRIYKGARDEHQALTQFVTTMVALVIGAYMTDLLIAGPDTSLLSDEEHTTILGFIKDVCLMVFSYYFGTRASGGSSTPSSSPQE